MSGPTLVPPSSGVAHLPGADTTAANPKDDAYLRLHRREQIVQIWVLVIALLFCAAMTIGFMVFAFRVVTHVMPLEPLAQLPKFDWHLLLIGSGLIIPPTIVMIAVLSKVYPRQKDSGTTEQPRADSPTSSITYLSAALRDVSKALTDVTGHLGK